MTEDLAQFGISEEFLSFTVTATKQQFKIILMHMAVYDPVVTLYWELFMSQFATG